MKKTLLIILFLVSTHSYSQIQKLFYVDDVKTIDYVTVNFCLNDSARIDKVNVIPKKTSYTNKDNIQWLVNSLKGFQYFYDSKLKNNCYDTTFEFVNKKYEHSKINKLDYSKCLKLKTGKFRYKDFRYLNIKIKRNKKIQREKGMGFKAKYLLKWTTPCSYEMKYLKVKGKENQYMVGKTIKVEIIDLLENSYIYLADFMDRQTVTGEIEKIN